MNDFSLPQSAAAAVCLGAPLISPVSLPSPSQQSLKICRQYDIQSNNYSSSSSPVPDRGESIPEDSNSPNPMLERLSIMPADGDQDSASCTSPNIDDSVECLHDSALDEKDEYHLESVDIEDEIEIHYGPIITDDQSIPGISSTVSLISSTIEITTPSSSIQNAGLIDVPDVNSLSNVSVPTYFPLEDTAISLDEQTREKNKNRRIDQTINSDSLQTASEAPLPDNTRRHIRNRDMTHNPSRELSPQYLNNSHLAMSGLETNPAVQSINSQFTSPNLIPSNLQAPFNLCSTSIENSQKKDSHQMVDSSRDFITDDQPDNGIGINPNTSSRYSPTLSPLKSNEQNGNHNQIDETVTVPGTVRFVNRSLTQVEESMQLNSHVLPIQCDKRPTDGRSLPTTDTVSSRRDLSSPFSKAAVARMQQIAKRRLKPRSSARSNWRELLSGTLGQLSALGLRRSSSVCSEPSLNTARKHRYEMLMMEAARHKFDKRSGTSRQRKQSKEDVPSMIEQRYSHQVNNQGRQIKNDQLRFNDGADVSGTQLITNVPLYRRNESDHPITMSSATLSSSPVLNSFLPPTSHPIRPVPRSLSCEVGKMDGRTQTRRRSGSKGNDTSMSRRLRLPSPLALYLFQCDCMLKALLYQVTPTPKEKEAKRQTFNALSHFLNAWKGNKIQIYVAGSTAYDVDSTTSDLDIVITTQGEENHLTVLHDLCEKIQMTKECCAADPSIKWPLQDVEMQVVQNARVPILLLKVEPQIVCDISVNAENSLCHTEFFKAILRDRDHLRSFMRIIKYWVRVRRLPAMRDGGLPSIVWMLLCVFLCRQCEVCYSPKGMSLAKKMRDEENERLRRDPHVSDLLKQERIPGHSFVGDDPPEQSPPVTSLMNFSSDYTRWLWSLNFTASQIPVVSPLTTLLGEFFAHLRSRKSLTCTMSVASGLIIPKNMDDVASRILSVPSHGGVWDEMLSVEDPAASDKDFFPNALLVDPTLMLDRKLEAPSVGENGIPSHYFKDLSSKISSATWLVYLYELRRGDDLIKKYILDNWRNPADDTIDDKQNHSMLLESHTNRLAGMFAALFLENPECRYWIPATLPVDQRHQRVLSNFNTNFTKDEDNEKNKDESVDGCIKDFFIVLLDGKLMIMKFIKICADREGWWSSDFLSRRDVRSHIHGKPFYCVVIPNLKKSGVESDVRWLICNSMMMDNIQLDTIGNKTLQSIDSTDNDVIFLPCNVVCQIRVKQIAGNSEVLEVPTDEVELIKSMLELLMESPFWFAKQPFNSLTSYGAQLQPAAVGCRICHQNGVTDFTNDFGFPHRPYDWISNAIHKGDLTKESTYNQIQNSLERFLSFQFGENIKESIRGITEPTVNPKPSLSSSLILRAKHEFRTSLPPLVLLHSVGNDHPHVDISGLPLLKSRNRSVNHRRPSDVDGRSSTDMIPIDRGLNNQHNNNNHEDRHWSREASNSGDYLLRRKSVTYNSKSSHSSEIHQSSSIQFNNQNYRQYDRQPPFHTPTTPNQYPTPNHTSYNQHLLTGSRNPIPRQLPTPHHYQSNQYQTSQFLMSQFPYPDSRGVHRDNSSIGNPIQYMSPVVTLPSHSPCLSPNTDVLVVARGQPFLLSAGSCYVYCSVVGLALTVHHVMPTTPGNPTRQSQPMMTGSADSVTTSNSDTSLSTTSFTGPPMYQEDLHINPTKRPGSATGPTDGHLQSASGGVSSTTTKHPFQAPIGWIQGPPYMGNPEYRNPSLQHLDESDRYSVNQSFEQQPYRSPEIIGDSHLSRVELPSNPPASTSSKQSGRGDRVRERTPKTLNRPLPTVKYEQSNDNQINSLQCSSTTTSSSIMHDPCSPDSFGLMSHPLSQMVGSNQQTKQQQAASPLSGSGSSLSGMRVPNKRRGDMQRYVPPSQRIQHSGSSIDGRDGSPVTRLGTGNSSLNVTRRPSRENSTSLTESKDEDNSIPESLRDQVQQQQQQQHNRSTGDQRPCKPYSDNYDNHNYDEGDDGGAGSSRGMGSIRSGTGPTVSDGKTSSESSSSSSSSSAGHQRRDRSNQNDAESNDKLEMAAIDDNKINECLIYNENQLTVNNQSVDNAPVVVGVPSNNDDRVTGILSCNWSSIVDEFVSNDLPSCSTIPDSITELPKKERCNISEPQRSDPPHPSPEQFYKKENRYRNRNRQEHRRFGDENVYHKSNSSRYQNSKDNDYSNYGIYHELDNNRIQSQHNIRMDCVNRNMNRQLNNNEGNSDKASGQWLMSNDGYDGRNLKAMPFSTRSDKRNNQSNYDQQRHTDSINYNVDPNHFIINNSDPAWPSLDESGTLALSNRTSQHRKHPSLTEASRRRIDYGDHRRTEDNNQPIYENWGYNNNVPKYMNQNNRRFSCSHIDRQNEQKFYYNKNNGKGRQHDFYRFGNNHEYRKQEPKHWDNEFQHFWEDNNFSQRRRESEEYSREKKRHTLTSEKKRHTLTSESTEDTGSGSFETSINYTRGSSLNIECESQTNMNEISNLFSPPTAQRHRQTNDDPSTKGALRIWQVALNRLNKGCT